MRTVLCLGVAAGTLWCAAAVSRAAVVGTMDDFQDVTTMGWSGYDPNITVKPGGGPLGVTDAYMRVNATGLGGPGSRLAVDNGDARWTGNYLWSGITALEGDFINVSSGPLEIRAVLFSGSFDRSTSTLSAVLPSDAAWHHLVFQLDSASLTNVMGTMSYNDFMSDITAVMFRHNSGAPSSGGTSVVGTMGLDNLHSIPAPTSALVLASGVFASRRRRGH
jgi:hypothetical protein